MFIYLCCNKSDILLTLCPAINFTCLVTCFASHTSVVIILSCSCTNTAFTNMW